MSTDLFVSGIDAQPLGNFMICLDGNMQATTPVDPRVLDAMRVP